MANAPKTGKSRVVRYNKWGYIFLIPFILVYLVFQMIPLFTTVYNSFFENYMSGLKQIGPNFVGLANYKEIVTNGDLIKYTENTLIMWILDLFPRYSFRFSWEHGFRIKGSDLNVRAFSRQSFTFQTL